MAVCTFFGHRECPETVKPTLQRTLEELVTTAGVDMFYVGNQGQFDAYVRSALQELTKKFLHIRYAVVLAYMPGATREHENYSDTMIPEGIETIHPHYAISWRNNWMLTQSDCVVAYITHTWGGAAKFVKRAQKAGKQVVSIA